MSHGFCRTNLFITLILFLSISCRSWGKYEAKLGILPSLAFVGQNQAVVLAHGTFLMGTSSFLLGPFIGSEVYTPDVLDEIYGGAIRFGDKVYFEVQGGYYRRKLSQNSVLVTGTGWAANTLLGFHWNQFLGMQILLRAKSITAGMEPRTRVDLLPMFSIFWSSQ